MTKLRPSATAADALDLAVERGILAIGGIVRIAEVFLGGRLIGARLAVTDRGLTFATNGRRGLRVSFHTPVHGLDPFGLISHPELTVTVADVERLAVLLSPA